MSHVFATADSDLNLLYFSRGKTMLSDSHAHPFYQLEICLNGDCRGRCGDNWVSIRPGHLWLIPPETPHSFQAFKKDSESCSLKFSTNRHLSSSTLYDDVTKYYAENLGKMLGPEFSPSPYTAAGKEIVEGQLRALLDHLQREGEVPIAQKSEFMLRIREEVSCKGYQINVKELSNLFGCSRSQLKYKFMKENGNSTSVKDYLNQLLLELVSNHLKYSNRSFRQIAWMTNFPDQSQFSRFIKKNTGMTPRRYREKLCFDTSVGIA